jgi:hypothetical protein
MYFKRRLLISALLLCLLQAPAAHADTVGLVAAEQHSANSMYRVVVEQHPQPIPLNQIHQWQIKVAGSDGSIIENAKISVAGGMPAHNHGLPTAPQVTEELSPGIYLVEGMKFQMGGEWQVTFTIQSEQITDAVTFELVL